MPVPSPDDLDRFVTAQAPVFARVLDELRAGRKTTHWMWFVFPQLRGLARSARADFYGIGSLAEAEAYLAHLLLGPRLVLATRTVLGVGGRSLEAIFGGIDAMKFRSSMTLFARAAGATEPAFQEALDRCCAGMPDERTLELLQDQSR